MDDIENEAPAWEIFCRVVDNFGDIAVSLRLARELAARSGESVRLWTDDWQTLVALCPAAGEQAVRGRLQLDGVDIRRWEQPFPQCRPGAVVIETFACELPPEHLQQMAAMSPPPCWINLEYLSAEDWVGSCHGLASPHPRLALSKHFFFPGFDERTGGLLREQTLFPRREAFLAGGTDGDSAARRWLQAQGVTWAPGELCISLFAYALPGIEALLARWQQGAQRVHLLVPAGAAVVRLAAALGRESLQVGESTHCGQLSVHVLPFVEQSLFDQLLWVCDINFVRGEDSFVRAQWAARPLVWQLYVQEEEAHFDKLEAFLACYLHGLEESTASALRNFWLAWNGRGEAAACWDEFAAALPQLRAHAVQWAGRQAALPDLASQLIRFSSHSRAAAG